MKSSQVYKYSAFHNIL